MRKLVLAATAVAALAGAGSAAAGGWATAGITPMPDGVDAGEPWNVTITVLRHGVTPTDGAKPSITIKNDAGVTKTFRATPTGKTGEYRARVVFPANGTWRYEVDNGLFATGYGESMRQTYTPVEIGGPGGGGSTTSLAWTLGGSAALACALALLIFLGRTRTPRPGIPAPSTN